MRKFIGGVLGLILLTGLCGGQSTIHVGSNVHIGGKVSLHKTVPTIAGAIYVDPVNGSDTNPGTLAQPVKSPQQATTLVRTSGKTRNLVMLHGGYYFLTTPWVFTSADSGSSASNIIYENFPGETPIISGGKQIPSSWVVNTDGSVSCPTCSATWSIDLTAAQWTKFQTLFYNDIRVPRPRTSTVYLRSGALTCVATKSPDCPQQNNCPANQFSCNRLTRAASDTSTTFHNLAQGEVMVDMFEHWTESKAIAVASDADPNPCTTTSTKLCLSVTPLGGTTFGVQNTGRYLIENVKEAFTQPGFAYLDICPPVLGCGGTWRLYYNARPGETPNTATIIVPQIPRLMLATNLSNVLFQGIAWEHDSNLVPATGTPGTGFQATTPAAVRCVICSNVIWNQNTLAHTGNFALEWIGASSPVGNQLTNSVLFDAGTGGLRVGQLACGTTGAHGIDCPTSAGGNNQVDTDANVAQGSIIMNNIMRGGNRLNASGEGVAIVIGNSHNNQIMHNTINDWYSGLISVGNTLNNPSTQGTAFAHDNVIKFNDLYDITEGVTNDNGAVHTATANGTGEIFSHNRCHDGNDNPLNGFGGAYCFYIDQGSVWTVDSNLMYRFSDNAIFMNSGCVGAVCSNTGLETITNNILAHGNKGLIKFGPDEVNAANKPRAHVKQNIFYYAIGNPQFGPYGQVGKSDMFCNSLPCTTYFDIDKNWYWVADPAHAIASNSQAFFTTDGSTSSFNPIFTNCAGWKALLFDVNSFCGTGDPLFGNPTYAGGAGDNYAFQTGSPFAGGTNPIGFIPFTSDTYGPPAGITLPPVPATVAATFPLQVLDKDTGYGTITTATVCGPPLFRCTSSDTVTTIQNSATPPFNSLDHVNSIHYDLSGINPVGVDPIVMVTDATTSANQICTVTPNGGDNDNIWNTDDTRLFFKCGGGSASFVILFDPTTMQVIGKSVNIPNSHNVTFSRTDPNVLYSMTTGGQIYKTTFTAGSVAFTQALFFDPIASTSVCTGVHGVTLSDGGPLSVDATDTNFYFILTTSGQNSVGWAVAYNTARNKCSSLDTNTGIVTKEDNSTVASTIPCFPIAIHAGFQFVNGLWGRFSTAALGGCINKEHFWQFNTANVKACPTGGTSTCGNHNTDGWAIFIDSPTVNGQGGKPQFYFWDVTTVTPPPPLGQFYLTSPNINDEHFDVSGFGPAIDTYPIIGEFVKQAWDGVSAFTQPGENEIFAVLRGTGNNNGTLKRFAHHYASTGSSCPTCDFRTLDAIGAASQTGRFFAFTTDDRGALGTDNLGHPMQVVMIIRLD